MRKLLPICLFLMHLLLFSCEEDLNLVLPEGEEQLIVEGHIEQGTPPVIVLTRTVPVFSDISLEVLEKSYVHDAQVTVTTAGQTYTLHEVAAPEFSAALRQVVSMQLGIPVEQLLQLNGFKYYVYTTDELTGEIGQSYQLRISHEGSELTATTTIPQLNPVDSLFAMPHPDPLLDSLRTLYYTYSDPDTVGNSIRYFTKRNSEPFYPGVYNSVFTDELMNGSTISYPLDRGEQKGQPEMDEELYSYFGVGDTVTVRWAAMDLPHYRFWSTLQSEQNSNGSPIGTPNVTDSNIKGGLGVWGGYGVTYHTIIIE